EAEYQRFEQMMERSSCLEVQARDLRWQLEEKTRAHDLLREEYEKAQTRLEASRLATERLTRAEEALTAAQGTKRRRGEGEQGIRQAERWARGAGDDLEEKSRRLEAAEQRLRSLRQSVLRQESQRRALQARLNLVNQRRQLLSLRQQRDATRDKLQRAE